MRVISRKMPKNLIFDVDSTIYPSSVGLYVNVGEKVAQFLCELLDDVNSFEEALILEKEMYELYGSAYIGISKEPHNHRIHFADFLDSVYKYVDTKAVLELGETIERKKKVLEMFDSFDREKVRLFVFSNGTKKHVQNVLEFYGIENGYFEQIVTVEDLSEEQYSNTLVLKPQKEAFAAALRKCNLDINSEPENIYFFDDHPQNIVTGNDIGWNCIFIDEKGKGNAIRNASIDVVRVEDILEIHSIFPEFFVGQYAS